MMELVVAIVLVVCTVLVLVEGLGWYEESINEPLPYDFLLFGYNEDQKKEGEK